MNNTPTQFSGLLETQSVIQRYLRDLYIVTLDIFHQLITSDLFLIFTDTLRRLAGWCLGSYDGLVPIWQSLAVYFVDVLCPSTLAAFESALRLVTDTAIPAALRAISKSLIQVSNTISTAGVSMRHNLRQAVDYTMHSEWVSGIMETPILVDFLKSPVGTAVMDTLQIVNSGLGAVGEYIWAANVKLGSLILDSIAAMEHFSADRLVSGIKGVPSMMVRFANWIFGALRAL